LGIEPSVDQAGKPFPLTTAHRRKKSWILHDFFMENIFRSRKNRAKIRSRKIDPITEAVFFPRIFEEHKRVFP